MNTISPLGTMNLVYATAAAVPQNDNSVGEDNIDDGMLDLSYTVGDEDYWEGVGMSISRDDVDYNYQLCEALERTHQSIYEEYVYGDEEILGLQKGVPNAGPDDWRNTVC